MTSTFLIQKRKENAQTWTFGDGSLPLGGQEDVNVRPWGECHPDFVAHPIEHQLGVKVCVRRNAAHERNCREAYDPNGPNMDSGYFRGSVNLYDPTATVPTQMTNPQYFHDRRIPWEGDLTRADLIHNPIRYNATGIKVMHAPLEGRDRGHPYFQYGGDFTPVESNDTGRRIATSEADNVPPPKYDVTRAHQPYPMWKEGSEYTSGVSKRRYDTTHFQRLY